MATLTAFSSLPAALRQGACTLLWGVALVGGAAHANAPVPEGPLVSTEWLAANLNRAGMHCSIDPQVQEAIWEKLAFNAAFNGVCAVTRQTVDGLANPQGEALLQRVLDEVLSVAHAHGVAHKAQLLEQARRVQLGVP